MTRAVHPGESITIVTEPLEVPIKTPKPVKEPVPA